MRATQSTHLYTFGLVTPLMSAEYTICKVHHFVILPFTLLHPHLSLHVYIYHLVLKPLKSCKARVRSQVSASGICGGQNDTGTIFFSEDFHHVASLPFQRNQEYK
jgi:hypothetical protein